MLRQCPRISILAWENKCRFRVRILSLWLYKMLNLRYSWNFLVLLLWYQFWQQIIFKREEARLCSPILSMICCQIWCHRKSDYLHLRKEWRNPLTKLCPVCFLSFSKKIAYLLWLDYLSNHFMTFFQKTKKNPKNLARIQTQADRVRLQSSA